MEPIRFHFDFVSTYSYFAVLEIDAVAARFGRQVDWIAVSLPRVFELAGTVSPLAQPLKLAHNQQDVVRLAAMRGLALRRPDGLPHVRWARHAFWALKPDDPPGAARFAREAMRLRFGEGVELNHPEALAAVAARAEVDVRRVLEAERDESCARRLVEATDAAVADGMFGAPYAVVDGQSFWGADRTTDHLAWHLSQTDQAHTSAVPSSTRIG